jgi:catechol 2,3-dioxygenase-like lactoylglutathione lyase family enzyme
MIDHLSIKVSDFEKTKKFYTDAFAPLGYEVAKSFPASMCLKPTDEAGATIWVSENDGPITPTHIAFRAKTTDAIKAFYDAAMAAGGVDNGAPGPRPNYGPGYYAAFVHDSDGNNIEAVMHDYKAE